MTDIDRILQDAGARWRSAQPEPAAIDASVLVRPANTGVTRGFLAAAAGVAIIVVVSLAAVRLGLPGAAGPASCDVTKPTGFAPPLHSARPGEAAGADAEWYGTAALWTALDRDGEVWHRLSAPPNTFSQKTFWWSAAYKGAQREPRPYITVSAERLDGTGSATFGPGTNAFGFGLGQSMLVGVELPSAGCWEITASYRDAELSYVVLATED